MGLMPHPLLHHLCPASKRFLVMHVFNLLMFIFAEVFFFTWAFSLKCVNSRGFLNCHLHIMLRMLTDLKDLAL